MRRFTRAFGQGDAAVADRTGPAPATGRTSLTLLAVTAIFVGSAALAGVGATAARVQTQAPRLVAIGDIHGAFEELVSILRTAGVIDAEGRWSGGRTRLVQTGDFTDRGAAVRQVMDLLMRLEDEARRAGGRVDVLFGNHEAMNVLRDLRDVSPAAYASFVDAGSESRRARASQAAAAAARRTGAPFDPDAWLRAHPPGRIEYIEAMNPSGRYGRWMRARKVALKLDDAVFMHAGFPVESTATVEEMNRTAAREVRMFDDARAALERTRTIGPAAPLEEILDAASRELKRVAVLVRDKAEIPPEITQEYVARLQDLLTINKWSVLEAAGPLWYRGYATLPESESPRVRAALERRSARRLVIGHNALASGRITTRFDTQVVMIDTGMLSSHFKGGRASALEFVDGKMTAIYPEGRETLAAPPVRLPLQGTSRSYTTVTASLRPMGCAVESSTLSSPLVSSHSTRRLFFASCP